MAESPYSDPYTPDTDWSQDRWSGGYGQGYGGSTAGTRRTAPSNEPSIVEAMLLALARTVWAFGLELLTLATVLAPTVAGEVQDHPTLGAVGSVALFLAAIGIGPVRRTLARVFHGAGVRRCWHRAVRSLAQSGNHSMRGQAVAIRKVRRCPAGDVLDVVVPVGATVADLDKAGEALAAILQLRDLRVLRHPANARFARVTLIRRDPLSVPAPPWPHLQAPRLSLWDPIPIGVDDDGAPVTVTLTERNVLLGGEPGAGKSAALSLLVATAALDPSVRLHLLDGKLVELAVWAGCADSTAGVDVADANLLLAKLRADMDARYCALLANKKRKVSPEDGLPLHLVVVDELAHYLTNGDRKDRALFADLMRDLVARGRAAGFIVLAATQKPQHDVIPTALRDLFGFRWALRCSTPQASDTVLGSGCASQGYTASDIDAAHRGVGLLRHEGQRPVRLRSHYLSDDDLAALASRAEDLRRPAGRKR